MKVARVEALTVCGAALLLALLVLSCSTLVIESAQTRKQIVGGVCMAEQVAASEMGARELDLALLGRGKDYRVAPHPFLDPQHEGLAWSVPATWRVVGGVEGQWKAYLCHVIWKVVEGSERRWEV